MALNKPSYLTMFPYLLVVAVGNMFIYTSVTNILLLYMNDLGYTSKGHESLYVKTVAVAVLGPVISSLLLGYLSDFTNPGFALVIGYLIVIFSLILIIFARLQVLMLPLGYLICSFAVSYRIIRFTLITQAVPPARRTFYMAIHQLMVPTGAMLGPISWLAFQTWQSRVVIIPDLFVLDRFALTYSFSIAVSIFLAYISYTKLQVRPFSDDSPSPNDNPTASTSPDSTNLDDQADIIKLPDADTSLIEPAPSTPEYGAIPSQPRPTSSTTKARRLSEHIAEIETSDGSTRRVDLRRYRNIRLAFFAVLLLSIRFVYSFAAVVFQPALVDRFHADDAAVGRAYSVIGLLAFIPPLAVAATANIASDRSIMLFGVVIKLIGIILYLPVFGRVRHWGLIVGYALVVKGSLFCTSSSISLFSKVLGPFSSATAIGYIWAIANLFPGVVQVMFPSQILKMYSTWWYALFASPALLSVAMVAWPSGWRMLNYKSEYSTLVLEAAYKRPE